MAGENSSSSCRKRIARKVARKEFAENLLVLLILLKIYFLIRLFMTKQFNTRIDARLDLKLRLYAAHLSCTKAEAGARAMAQGIPSWVMAVPPSVARTMGSENDLTEAADQIANDDYLAQAFEEES